MKKKLSRMKNNAVLPEPMEDIKPSPIITDPQGCYTGRPIETYEIPVQDADDL